MEVILQCLDEIDDLVFAGVAVWRRLRRLCLAVALGAAIALHALPRLGLAADVMLLLEVSLLSLAVWTAIAALSAGIEQSGQSPGRSA